MLVVGRVVVGLGIGVSAAVVPAYLGEVAPARGGLASWCQRPGRARQLLPQPVVSWDIVVCRSLPVQLPACPRRPSPSHPAQPMMLPPNAVRGRVVECYELLLCAGMLAAALGDAAFQALPANW